LLIRLGRTDLTIIQTMRRLRAASFFWGNAGGRAC
jgi:hypothetical protein